MTLVTPVFTPIGLALSLRSAFLNHSCSPNTVHVFSGGRCTVKSLGPLPVGAELTTSYIDRSFPPSVRQLELKSRWFFDCSCSACSSSTTLDRADPPTAFSSLPEHELKALFELEDDAAGILISAQGARPAQALPQLARAYRKFSTPPATKVHYPPWRQPLSKTRTELMLALLAFRRWVPALLLHLVQYVLSDPVTFPGDKHPVRVAHGWILARLVAEVGARAHAENGEDEDERVENEAAKALAERFQINWGVLLWSFVSDVAGKAVDSHGEKSRLVAEVGKEYMRLSEEMRSMGGQPPPPETLKLVQERLAVIAKEGWQWWREWERNRVGGEGRLIRRIEEATGTEKAIEVLCSDDPD